MLSGDAAAQAMQLKRQLEPFSGDEIAAPVAYPQGDGAWFGENLAGAGGDAERRPADPLRLDLGRPAASTPTTTRRRASTTTSASSRLGRRLPGRPRGARARRPRDHPVWSEFGRRPEENDSGTDHGAAGAAFVVGTRRARPDGRRVPRPRASSTPTTTCAHTSDFRGLYCSLIEQWFGRRRRRGDPGRRRLCPPGPDRLMRAGLARRRGRCGGDAHRRRLAGEAVARLPSG